MTTINELKDLATLAGVIIATTSLVFTAVNVRRTSLVNRARFWLDLRENFAKHDDVHRLLRPGGAWHSKGGPSSADEWAQVEAYMGLFEHCEIMLDEKLIDEQTFSEIYRYRLRNLMANEKIRTEKLEKHAGGWRRFLHLVERMN